MNYHPEQPARIEACIEALRPLDFIELQDVSSQSLDGQIDTAFSQSELRHARDMLVETHSEEFSVKSGTKMCKVQATAHG
jgi:hypothetical protein